MDYGDIKEDVPAVYVNLDVRPRAEHPRGSRAHPFVEQSLGAGESTSTAPARVFLEYPGLRMCKIAYLVRFSYEGVSNGVVLSVGAEMDPNTACSV